MTSVADYSRSRSANKTRHLISAALARQGTLRYRPVDISEGALTASARALVDDYESLTVEAYASDYVSLLERGGLRCAEERLVSSSGTSTLRAAVSTGSRL